MKGDLVAAVEEHSGHDVLAFLSDHHIDPDIAVEVFILKPRTNADGSGVPASPDGDGPGDAAA